MRLPRCLFEHTREPGHVTEASKGACRPAITAVLQSAPLMEVPLCVDHLADVAEALGFERPRVARCGQAGISL